MKVLDGFSLIYHLYRGYSWGYSDKLVGFSADITSKCNLRCQHCYWWQQKHPKDLTDAQWFKKIKALKKSHPYIVKAIWLGGEPLLRIKLLEKLTKLFFLNTIITNGTIALPRWKHVGFTVSVDGIKKDYEKIRGKGIYDRVKENILKNKNQNVYVICSLNRINVNNIEKFIQEWLHLGIKGVSFNIYTEIKGKKNDLAFSTKERDQLLDRLILLKAKYGKFIYNTKEIYQSMKSNYCLPATAWCRQYYSKIGISFDCGGKAKKQCIFGDQANCNYCGCPVPYYIWAIKNKDFKTIFTALNNGM